MHMIQIQTFMPAGTRFYTIKGQNFEVQQPMNSLYLLNIIQQTLIEKDKNISR